jgi:VanZ family protein
MAAIFFLSTRPVPAPVAQVPDWASHAAGYALLAVLVGRALAGGRGRPASAGQAAGAVAFAFAYGLAMEFVQSFVPGRVAEASDLVKNLAGATAGAIACALPRGRHGRSTA